MSRTCNSSGLQRTSFFINYLAIVVAAFVLFPAPLNAAGVASLAVSSANGLPGATTLLNLSLSTSSGAQPAASQWVISYPVQNVTAISLTASAAVTNAQKQLSCIAGATAGTLNCILIGLNQNVIPTGTIATIAVQISATPSSSSVPIGVSAVTFSDVDGNYVDLSPLPSGGSIALPVVTIQPSSLSCSPSSVNAPGSATCTVTLTAVAPTGGVTVSLTSSNSVVQVPASVTVPSGSTSRTFSATVGSIATNLSSVITATAGGASRTFVLSASAADLTAPFATISLPTTAATYASTQGILNLSGTAEDNVGVTQVSWSNNRGGGGFAQGTANWSISGVSLAMGLNTITVTAQDAAGNSGMSMITVTYDPNTNRTKVGVFRQGTWLLDDGNLQWDGPPTDSVSAFGLAGDIPLVGDWNGDGKTEIGVFRNGEWFLDANGNGQWDGPSVDMHGWFGGPGDKPVVGDWDGSGRTKVGVFRRGVWVLDMDGNIQCDNGLDLVGSFGATTDIPVVGDWDGSRRTKVGVYRDGVWILDMNGNAKWDDGIDRVGSFGAPGDIILLGDWTGSGTTKVGVYRNGAWVLDMNGNSQWDPGVDLVGSFGGPVDRPVVGDWDGQGVTRVGIYRNGVWILDMNGNAQWDSLADFVGSFGAPTDIVLTGNWARP